jgi:hypothetical protein
LWASSSILTVFIDGILPRNLVRKLAAAVRSGCNAALARMLGGITG